MKKIKISTSVLWSFLFGILVGMAFLSTVNHFMLKNIPKTENQEFAKVFEKENIKVKITIPETVPIEIKEIAELLMESFTYQLAGSMIVCEDMGTTEYLIIINDVLTKLTEMMMESLIQKNLKIPQDFKDSKNRKTGIF